MCRIIREQDEKVCITCGKRWEASKPSPSPQECNTNSNQQSVSGVYQSESRKPRYGEHRG